MVSAAAAMVGGVGIGDVWMVAREV